MRKPIVILVLLLIIGAALGALVWSRRSVPMLPPSISFIGRDPGTLYGSRGLYVIGRDHGIPHGAAGFYVTNNSNQAIYLQNYQLQISYGGRWISLLPTPVTDSLVSSPFLRSVMRNIQGGSAILEPGDYRTIVVDWPADHPWRVCLAYKREAKGLKLFLERAKTAWKTRSFSRWRSRMWANPAEQVLSQEISK